MLIGRADQAGKVGTAKFARRGRRSFKVTLEHLSRAGTGGMVAARISYV
ncbi:MAG: hypothetical protein KBF98_17325 [Rhodoferax sp.]|nr:hypothetical protein [Rhodoferax sp.]